ncbi:hypothetical protein Poli38472_005117 [Pythium oligandrum]|uniref:Uncharacterized protein n=1 Tax=Pythium oligandrum TaxID=41045 RepID=A0A8K1CFH2_PYTOL|nr:hypothetical protein Poli38472_005117 [Pythium oligandrum]|eukprot:TMW62499.1 hypothetical protein Poli38472_005117 [Pythium oligandrum]
MPLKPAASTPKAAAPATPSAKQDEKPEDTSNVAQTPTDEEEALIPKHGVFSFADGATYTGEYRTLQGKVVRHGHGVYHNGPERYDGAWEQDQMHGHGVYQFATGAVYDGEFQHNVFHGQGRYQWSDGACYEGHWRHGRMHDDAGRYVDRDGVDWKGRFFNGKYDNGRIFHTLR